VELAGKCPLMVKPRKFHVRRMQFTGNLTRHTLFGDSGLHERVFRAHRCVSHQKCCEPITNCEQVVMK